MSGWRIAQQKDGEVSPFFYYLLFTEKRRMARFLSMDRSAWLKKETDKP
jgi:hypothetical protein